MHARAAQLIGAEEQVRGNEELELMWLQRQFELQEILAAGTVPATDSRSGGEILYFIRF